jgi:hypothetical protein
MVDQACSRPPPNAGDGRAAAKDADNVADPILVLALT